MTHPHENDADGTHAGDPQAGAADDGPIVPPAEWSGGTARQHDLAQPPQDDIHRLGGATGIPGVTGVSIDRATQHNGRAIVGVVLSGIAVATLLVWFTGFSVPFIITIVAAIAGIVYGTRGLQAARRGQASNRGLAITAIVLGAVALLGVVAIFALVIIAVSQLAGA